MRKLSLALCVLVALGLVLSGCETPVSTVKVTGVTVNPTTLSLVFDNTKTSQTAGAISATVAPANASIKTLTWNTSNAAVATVAAGVVTPTGAGVANITVRTTDGNFTAVCAVTVTAASHATAVAISGVSAVLQGQKINLTAATTPTTTNDTIAWSVDNSAIATVSAAGVVTGVSAGTAVITATAGTVTDTHNVVVTAAEVVNLPANGAYGYQQVFTKLSSGSQIATGDTYILTIAGVSDVSIADLKALIVDNSATATPTAWWSTLSSEILVGAITAGTPFSYTVNIPATSGASSTAASANKLVINCGTAVGVSPNLSLTTFTFAKQLAAGISVSGSNWVYAGGSTRTLTATLTGVTGTVTWATTAANVTLAPSTDTLSCVVTSGTASATAAAITATVGTTVGTHNITVYGDFPKSGILHGTTYSGVATGFTVGATSLDFEYLNTAASEVLANGGTLVFSYKLYGASGFKQAAVQGTWNAWGWTNCGSWFNDGVPEGTTIAITQTATAADADGWTFKLRFDNPITGYTVTDTQILIKDFSVTYTAP